ncbi:hypothetical protein O3M35_001116 [Rhynocoris fuscipes]|uniref:Uncharacterized protein n=1 Tax=Rhynocoris fuscipes TaxID=488301 RepID=A0AAW1DSX6_9HEMI
MALEERRSTRGLGCEGRLDVEVLITGYSNLMNVEVDYLQRNYTELSEELPKIKTSDEAQMIKTRNVELKTELVSLKSNLDEKTIKGLMLLSAYQESSDNIVNEYESLCDDIDIFIEKTADMEQSIIANNCIEIIKKRNFELADNQFNQITDKNKISYIVNKTYSPRNFYTILNLTDHITNIAKRFYILNELNKEMRINGHMTANKLITLANSLSNKVVNVPMFDNEITPKAIELMDLVKTDIKTLTVMHLVDVLQDNKTIKDCNVELLTKILSLDIQLTFDILYQSYMFSDNSGESLPSKFKEIFERLLNSSSTTLLDTNVIELIKNFFVKVGYADYADITINSLNNIPLPEIVRNVLTAKKVGIYNSGYLRSSSDSMNSKYGVFTYTGSGYVIYEFWMLKRNGTFYKIRSYPFENYYLDVDKDNNVFLNNEISLKNGYWKLEIQDEKQCLIRNVGNNKYLYTSSSNSPAVTNDLDSQNNGLFLWTISDLSDK